MSDYFISVDKTRAILMDPSVNATDIADRHGVSDQIVRLYKRLKIAKVAEVAESLRADGMEPVLWFDKPHHKRFLPAQIVAIRASKASSKVLAREYGCSSALVRMIRTGKAYVGVGVTD